MKSLILLALGLSSSVSIAANGNSSLYKRYYSGAFQFDGKRVVENSQGYAVNNSERWARLDKNGSNYQMSWDSEKNDNDEMLVINESIVSKQSKTDEETLYGKTSSFVGNKLRSSTVCYGARGKTLGVQNSNMKCVTATRRACDRLMQAYHQESSKNRDLAQGATTSADKVKKTQELANKCMSFIDSYAVMGKAMANQSSQLKRQHDLVIDQDIDRLKGHMKADSSLMSFTSLKSAVSADELEKNVRSYSETLEGMRAMSEALQVCMESQNDFTDGATIAAAGTSGSGKSARGVR